MERIVIAPELDIEAQDGPYLEAIVDQVLTAAAAAIAIENDYAGRVRCEVSMRRFTDPKAQRIRWCVMINGDEFELRDYPTKREATGAFRTFVAQCAAEGTVWAAVRYGEAAAELAAQLDR